MSNHVLPDLCIGWHVREPDAPPPSPLYDDPPVVPADQAVAAHQAWRSSVEADDHRIQVQYQQQPIWFPVSSQGAVRVLPIFGGTPQTIEGLVSTIAGSALISGFEQVRVVNLTQWRVLEKLRSACTKLRGSSAIFGEVGSTGSTINVFEHRSLDDLASVLVDSLRTDSAGGGRKDVARDKQALIAVGSHLTNPVTLDRLCSAIDVALGNAAGAASTLSDPEKRALRDFAANTVSQRRALGDRLADLHSDLLELRCYAQDPSRRPQTFGNGPTRLLASEAKAGTGSHDFELAREILGRAVARKFASPARGREMLVVVGADSLAPDVLTSLTDAAEQHGKQLVLLFSRITPEAQATMGHAGSSCCVFLRLPNHQDAQIAAEQLGREYTFVVNGISISEGSTSEWSTAATVGTSSSTARGTSSSSNSGSAGGSLSFGRTFGSSVTRTLSNSQSTTTTQGGGTSTTHQTSQGRVHEYVVEPDVFQKMQESMMLVVTNDTVMLANCDPSIRRLPQTSPSPLAIP